MRNGILLALLVAVASTGSAFAIDRNTGIKADAILSQQQQIRAELTSRSGPFKDMEESKRSDVSAKQDVVFHLLEGKQNSGELNEPQRVELFNALEAIEATVNNARDEQVICEHVKQIGSNRPQKVCKTYAQREKEREAARKIGHLDQVR
jgi:hypothetical protein